MALTEEQKMEVALFRFGLIAPLLNNQVDDPKAYLEMLLPGFTTSPATASGSTA